MMRMVDTIDSVNKIVSAYWHLWDGPEIDRNAF